MAEYTSQPDNRAGGRGQLTIGNIVVDANPERKGFYDITATLSEGNANDNIRTTISENQLHQLLKSSGQQRCAVFRSFFPHWSAALSPEHLNQVQLEKELNTKLAITKTAIDQLSVGRVEDNISQANRGQSGMAQEGARRASQLFNDLMNEAMQGTSMRR